VSNYGFVLLIPYMIIVIFSNSQYSERIKRLGFWVIIAACLLSASTLGFKEGWSYPVYFLFASISKLPFETANLLFNFWFIEIFLLSLAVLAFAYCLCWYKSYRQDRIRWSNREDLLVVSMLLVIMEVLCRYLFLKVRYTGPVAIALIILIYYRTQRLRIFFFNDTKNRLSLAFISGVLLLLTLSPFSWRDLREVHFLIVLLPFLLVLIYTTFSRTVLLTFSVLLSVSGLLYVTSNGITDYFPPKSLKGYYPTAYENVFAYSDRYLRSDKGLGEGPYFTDMDPFDGYCRVCKMGTNKIPYDELESLTVVAWSVWKPTTIPSGFVCSRQGAYGLSWTDRFQFKYFRPIYPRHFSTYQCERGAK
jgi:hypothetical protein